MKKFLAFALVLTMLLPLAACTPNITPNTPDGDPSEKVEITLCTFPIGGYSNVTTLSSLLGSFHRDYPNIHVTPMVVDYTNGDAQIEEAIAANKAPDIVLEGSERLVANWGARGLMADISDLWTGKANQIDAKIKAACHDGEKYYIYPMCMTTHCMAINKDLFVAADAWQYVDEETHTWTTENFFKAVDALQKSGLVENVAAIYCGGQAGDQGTRALDNNLYSGTFTNAEHTAYTLNSQENIKALKQLKETPGIIFADNMLGADEIAQFCEGKLAMAFCWNVFQELSQTANQTFDFDIFPMAFPTDDGVVNLQGGIWGFGIFDNKDEAKIKAAKTFINYMMQDDTRYANAVTTSTYLPVRDIPGLYENNKLMQEYQIFGKYFGDYYQVTDGWANARKAWYEMLQKIGSGTAADVEKYVQEFSDTVNDKD